MKKRIILSLLIICCCSLLLSVGCSKKSDTAKVTPKTPIQLANDRINASDTINTRQDQNLIDLSNRITTEIAAVSHYNDAPLIARVTALEAFNISDLIAQNAYQNIRLASLESYNISARLATIEARLNASVTPTPVPTSNCTSVTKPVAIYPELGNMSIVNGSILFRWQDSNASGYEFWFGTNPASLLKVDTLSKDALFYQFPATSPNTYYFWRVVAISPCGNLSTMWWFKTQ